MSVAFAMRQDGSYALGIYSGTTEKITARICADPNCLLCMSSKKKHSYTVCQNDGALKFSLWKKLVYSSVNSKGLNWKARSSCKPNSAFQDNRLGVSNEYWSICLPTLGLCACLLKRTGISLKYILINTCYKNLQVGGSLSKTSGV